MFGFDYLIDADFNTWLIEVNTNPCLEESSTLLKKLIPRMINDAFKLSLDELFPPIKKFQSDTCPAFHVDKYTDGENMWEMLGNISEYQQLDITILRSEYIYFSNDSLIFKVKKLIKEAAKESPKI